MGLLRIRYSLLSSLLLTLLNHSPFHNRPHIYSHFLLIITYCSYLSTAADDEICAQENRVAFHRVWLKPRILVDVSRIDTSSDMLGYKLDVPLFIWYHLAFLLLLFVTSSLLTSSHTTNLFCSPTAIGKLAHNDGELALARAAHTRGILQMIPTMASYSLEVFLNIQKAKNRNEANSVFNRFHRR